MWPMSTSTKYADPTGKGEMPYVILILVARKHKLGLDPVIWGTVVGPTVKQTGRREDKRICVQRSSNVIGLI